MSITASDLVNPEILAGKDELWMPPALFLPDWSKGVTVHSSWVTDVTALQSAGEARAALASKPSRSMDVTFVAMDQGEAVLLRSLLQRMAMARTPIPLYCDQTPLLDDVLVNDSFLPCVAASRRFFAGGRVAIWSGRSMATAFDLVVIGVVTDDGLFLAGNVAHSYPAGSMVAPVMEAELVTELSAVYETDTILTAQLTFRETVGPTTLDAMLAPGTVPDGVATQDDLPIFALPADWSGRDLAGGAQRSGETSKVGLATYTETHGTRFSVTQNVSLLQMDRAQAGGLLRFLDSRGGRQKPFLAADLTSDFVLAGTIGQGSTAVLLSIQAPLRDWDWRTHLAFELADGTLLVRKITTVERADDKDQVNWTQELPEMTAPVRIAAAFIARFASDELQENWVTDSILRAKLPQIEALREQAFDLDHAPAAPARGGGRAPRVGGSGAVSAERSMIFSMEDIPGTFIPGGIPTSNFDFDVEAWGQEGPGDYPNYDASIQITGPICWKPLYTDPARGSNQWGLFQIVALEAGTLTVVAGYSNGYGKAFFPIVNGLRVTWSDGSKYGMFTDVATLGEFKTLVVAQGDSIEIGQIITDDPDHAYWSHANASGGYPYESIIRDDFEPNASSKAVSGEVRTLTLGVSRISEYDVFTVAILGDGGIAWEFGTPPAGVTITPASGVGPATVTVDTTGGSGPGTDAIDFQCQLIVRGTSSNVVRQLIWGRL